MDAVIDELDEGYFGERIMNHDRVTAFLFNGLINYGERVLQPLILFEASLLRVVGLPTHGGLGKYPGQHIHRDFRAREMYILGTIVLYLFMYKGYCDEKDALTSTTIRRLFMKRDNLVAAFFSAARSGLVHNCSV